MIARRIAFLAGLATTLFGCTADDVKPSPTPPPMPWIHDEQGRAMILHGVNVDMGAKQAKVPAIDQTDVDRIAKTWGFDFVRYLIVWEAVEPQPNQYDDAYLNAVVEQIGWFHDAGVSVLVDVHQDVYARKFCCDGAPEWAIRDDGLPFELQSLWSFNYFQPAVTRAFDNFWDADGPHADLQQHYADMLRHVAQRMRDVPGVIGYDVMNEPYPGSDFDPLEAAARVSKEDGGTSRIFDETKFAPFYDRMIAAIREGDPDRWIFFEPRFGAAANGSPSWLPALRDTRSGEPRLAYAPHLYSVIAEANLDYAETDVTVERWEAERKTDMERHLVPLVLGEWGFSWSTVDANRYAEDILSMSDRMRAGWAYWSYGPGDAGSWSLYDGTGADNPQADIVVRPYPRRVAGVPQAWAYEPNTRIFTLDVDDAPGVSGATEIVVPARHYPTGFVITVNPDADGTWDSVFDDARGVLSLTLAASSTTHHVVIAPK